jgi:hypothetical protein
MMTVPKEANHHHHRCTKKAPGTHTSEFQQAQRKHALNPLSEEMSSLIVEKLGTVGITKLRPFIKLCILECSLLPPLQRLECRQEFALFAYVSKNWNILRTYFVPDIFSEFNQSEFQQILEEFYINDPN